MGKSMCSHVLNAGYEVAVFNRTESKAKGLADNGATLCTSPAEVAERSDLIFTIVGYPVDVEEVYFGEEGIFSRARSGSTVIDMTTSEPVIARRIAETAQEKGMHALDAPVSGGDVGAREGKLAIMVGGEKAAFDDVYPLFQLMGTNIKLLGDAGAGQDTKMCNQILIASTMIGVVESLLYAYKAGLGMNDVIGIIGRGAASSWSINNLGTRIAKGDFDPGFIIRHFVKDMGIALKEAGRMNLSLPGLALANQFYVSSIALGFENLGTQGLYKVLARMNGVSEG
jgi:3-hydroxyisobutyrate dehydrogenase